MRYIWNWTADNAGALMALMAILGGFAAILQFSVVRPMQQGFAAVNQRIDDQIEYIDQRLDDQDRSINQRFDDQDRYINQRFDAQDASTSTSVSTPWTSAWTTRTGQSTLRRPGQAHRGPHQRCHQRPRHP